MDETDFHGLYYYSEPSVPSVRKNKPSFAEGK